jgi:divalent metal cation (Fe/Co/Zn/Cd) transporter
MSVASIQGDPAVAVREAAVRQGRRLEYFTIAYNCLEGVVSIVAGVIAGSVSLIGFGLDSAIEVGSGGALLWRLHHDRDVVRRERMERIALRIVGWCFVALAIYVGYEATESLLRREAPDRSLVGIAIAAHIRGDHAGARTGQAEGGGGAEQQRHAGGLAADGLL